MWSAALALGVLLLGTACSGGGSSSKDAASSTEAAVSTAKVKPVRSKAECLRFAQAVGEATTLISEGMAGTIYAWDPLGDVSGFHGRDVVQDYKKFALVAAGAPDEVKASFTTINGTLARLTKAVQGVTLDGFTPPTASQRATLDRFQSQTDTRKIARAQGRLTTWFDTRCPYY